ncbi:MAG: excinuclease ABC subunit UvrC [Candidatus Edwardsbacteria bacterium]
MNQSLLPKIENLPQKPGVYLFKDTKGNIIYIGKAKSLYERIRNHFQNPFEKFSVQTCNFDYIVTDSEIEALILEASLIKRYLPRYNIRLKDDKKFPYIKITNEPFPRVYWTRNLKEEDSSKLFGPYTNAKAMRQTLKLVRKIFPVRSCKLYLPSSRKIRACLNFHLGRCYAPCEGRVDSETYQTAVEQVYKFLSGKMKGLLQNLREKMQENAEEENFEAAAKYRDQLKAVEKVMEKQKVLLSDEKDRDLFALAISEEQACVVVFQVREGRLIGKEDYRLKGVGEKKPSEIISAFLEQYYLKNSFLPEEIIVEQEIEEKTWLESWLNQRNEDLRVITSPKGEVFKLLQMAKKNAELILEEEQIQREGRIPSAILELQKIFHLSTPPRQIVAFDISNLGTSDAVGSLVFFSDGKPKKSEYRRFKVKSVQGQDDFAMMKEVVSRYFTRLNEEKKERPDLVLVDGGIGQLNAALNSLEELGFADQPVLGLAKRLDEIYLPRTYPKTMPYHCGGKVRGLPDESKSIMIPRDSQALRLLKHLRDEAHRFAITYHRTLRHKKTRISELDKIKGIGTKRKSLLLTKFGSLSQLKKTSLQEITELLGEKVGRMVYDSLHSF